MNRPELHETLVALVDAFDGSGFDGQIQVTDAELTVPFELVVVAGGDGLKAYGAPPQSRFASGVMQPVHRVYIRAALEATEVPE